MIDNEVIPRHSADGPVLGPRCDYEDAARILFESIFEERKEKMKGRDIHDIAFNIDLKHYPGWDDNLVDQLRNEFEASAVTKPGSITFDEL